MFIFLPSKPFCSSIVVELISENIVHLSMLPNYNRWEPVSYINCFKRLRNVSVYRIIIYWPLKSVTRKESIDYFRIHQLWHDVHSNFARLTYLRYVGGTWALVWSLLSIGYLNLSGSWQGLCLLMDNKKKIWGTMRLDNVLKM